LALNIESVKQAETLDKQVSRAEQEPRMVLPGIQALFGFQLIAVFNNAFFEKISTSERLMHFIAICMTSISAMLIMTPASYHRQSETGFISSNFVFMSSRFIRYSMIALSLSISLEVDIIAHHVLRTDNIHHMIAFILFMTYMSMWFVFPKIRSNRVHHHF